MGCAETWGQFDQARTSNINIEHREKTLRCWTFDVGCSMFSFGTIVQMPQRRASPSPSLATATTFDVHLFGKLHFPTLLKCRQPFGEYLFVWALGRDTPLSRMRSYTSARSRRRIEQWGSTGVTQRSRSNPSHFTRGRGLLGARHGRPRSQNPRPLG
jgi:hypothetical protein